MAKRVTEGTRRQEAPLFEQIRKEMEKKYTFSVKKKEPEEKKSTNDELKTKYKKIHTKEDIRKELEEQIRKEKKEKEEKERLNPKKRKRGRPRKVHPKNPRDGDLRKGYKPNPYLTDELFQKSKFYIYDFAHIFNISTWTIRKWEKRGYITRPGSDERGYRLYTREELIKDIELILAVPRKQWRFNREEVEWALAKLKEETSESAYIKYELAPKVDKNNPDDDNTYHPYNGFTFTW